MRIFRYISLFCLAVLMGYQAMNQNISNKGTDFWVGYGLHQFMEQGQTNSQEMILYLSAEQAANVRVQIHGTSWVRNYTIAANTVIASDLIPKAGTFDARLISLPCTFVPPGFACGGEGKFSNKAIHITSDVPIVAYAHIYGSASSGATMLIPVEAWGYLYYSLNSKQDYATNCFSWCYAIAEHDSTVIEVTPSVSTRTGTAAGTVITVNLNKGDIYQVMAGPETGSAKPEMTGTKIKSVANANGECFPIAVFSGSSRTSNPQTCGSGGGDNDNQQCFPTQAWGKRYLTAPTSSSGNAATPMTNSFKIIVKDPNTVVKRNGVVLTGLINGSFYTYTSNTADYIEANVPIMVGQFMTGGGCLGGGNLGDPEMMYISPIEQGIKKVGFYRNNREAITVNYLTLIIPTGGIPSLRIDGSNIFDATYAHPNYPGYSVVVKRWNAAPTQAVASSDSIFTAITYGLGNVESYGYNAGTFINNLSAISTIRNVNDSTVPSHIFTCSGTPVKIYALFTAYQPTKLVWSLSDSIIRDKISPNNDVVINNPAFIDSVIISGIRYYRYQLPGDYVFNDTGTILIPVYSTHPTIENCRKTELLKLAIKVAKKPVIDFSAITVSGNDAGCISDTVFLTGTTTSGTGLQFSRWTWDFPDGLSSHTKDTFRLFSTPGVKSIKLTGITTEGCLGDTTKDITIFSRPVTTITSTPSNLCVGGSVQLNAQTNYGDTTDIISWNWDFGNGQTLQSNTNNPQSITYPAYGTYTVREVTSVSALCHSDTAFKVVTVYALPDVGFSYPAGCLPANGTVQFTGASSAPDGQAINGYAWNFGDPNASVSNPNTSSIANPTHFYSSIGNYSIQFSATTVNGCFKDTTVNASFNLKPSLTFAAIPPVCGSATATVSVANATLTNGVPGSGIYRGPGTDTVGNFNPVIAGAGVHTIWYVYTTNAGCKDSVSQTIQVRAKPLASFSSNQSACANSTGQVLFSNASSVSDGQTLAYNWEFNDPNANAGNPNTSASLSPSHIFSEGTFNVKLTTTTNFGCIDDTTISIPVRIQPLLSFPALNPLCQSDAAISIANASVTNGLTGNGYYSGPGTSSTGNFNPAGAGFGNHVITYYFTSSGGCTDSIARNIQVRAVPYVFFGNTASGCLPANGLVQFTNSTTIQDGQTLSYNWTFNDPNANAGNPNTSTAVTPTHFFTEGTYNINLLVTTNNGCFKDTTIITPLSVKPALTFPALSEICQNISTGTSIALATVTNGVNGAGLYSGPGTTVAGIFIPSQAGAGQQTIKYVFTSLGGCSDSITQTILVNPKPLTDFNLTTGVCQGDAVSITDNSSVSTGSLQSWNWILSDGFSTVNNNGNPFTHTFPSFGNYSVKLVAISDKNCISDTGTRFALVHANPIANFNTPPFVCMPNGTAVFSNTSQAPDNAALSYQWDFGDGSAASTAVNPSHMYPGPLNTVDITLQVISSFGCVDDTVKTINTFYDKPVADFSVTPPSICQGVTNIFSDNSSAPNSTVSDWLWNFGDGSAGSLAQNPTHKYNAPGRYIISLIVKNQVGCTSDPYLDSVIVNLQPRVDAGWSFVVPEGTTIRLAPIVNDSSVLQFLWTPQGDIINPTQLRPSFVAMNDHVYTLTATGPGNCVASDSMYVKILKPFTIPNAFSPNGDNINDKWVIKNLSDYPGVKVDVYNRYGQVVFSSVGYPQPWDGTVRGKALPVGTYYYIIKPRNDFEPISGSVTIIR